MPARNSTVGDGQNREVGPEDLAVAQRDVEYAEDCDCKRRTHARVQQEPAIIRAVRQCHQASAHVQQNLSEQPDHDQGSRNAAFGSVVNVDVVKVSVEAWRQLPDILGLVPGEQRSRPFRTYP